MMETEWTLFGDKKRFAFEYRFRNDPDNGYAATLLESVSWGEYRFWVRGWNMCQYHHRGAFHQETAWYLFPLFDWLVENWDPLFHEERFPLPCEKPNARVSYMDSLRRYLGDVDPAVEAKGEAWYGWWQRHALRSCRQGGLFPDLFFRRLVDFSEISWGNFPIEGVAEDFYFTVPQGMACFPVEQVVEPLLEGLQAAVAMLQAHIPFDEALGVLASRLSALSSHGRLDDRLSWYASKIAHVGSRVRSLVDTVLNPEEGTGFIRRLSPAVVMFGSLAPNIGDADLELLFQSFVDAHQSDGRDSKVLASLISSDLKSPERTPFDAGYDAALDLLDALDMADPALGSIDVQAICQKLDVHITKAAMTDSNIRGVAFAGKVMRPTILINIAHPNNKQDEGERFTIGHELCHVLHDRFFGGDVSIASGPWAPANVEKRANAFSAMLLMPLDRINANIESMTVPLDTLEGITQLACDMRVSRRACFWHLYNLNKLDDGQKACLEREVGGVGGGWL